VSVRYSVVQLLREKRYDEALSVLYAARAEAPQDRDLQRSIAQLKEFLVGRYAKQLGGMDRVAGPIPLSAVRSPDAMVVTRYVDGRSTFGDIAQSSPLGQLRTLQVLVALYASGDTEPPRAADDAGPSSRPHPIIDPTTLPTRLVEASSEPREHAVEHHGHPPPPVETEDDRIYRDTFGRGTTAFVQSRFEEAAEAFDTCARLRPEDAAARVMLRRALGALSR
jgi:hypothetical protein